MDHTKADEDWADERVEKVHVKDKASPSKAEKSETDYYEDNSLGM
jgi:hypothetical protein